MKAIDLSGKRFGKLIALKITTPNSKSGGRWWECLCDCGNIAKVSTDKLRRGTTKSCGCYFIDRVTKHGHNTGRNGRSATYNTWDAMMQRCTNPNHISYKNYGGRGIKICERWHNFKNFLEDMGDRPFPKAQIDRINNDGNYEPNNCRWADHKMNCRNNRKTKLNKEQVLYIRAHKDKSLRELSEQFNVRPDYISCIRRNKRWVF